MLQLTNFVYQLQAPFDSSVAFNNIEQQYCMTTHMSGAPQECKAELTHDSDASTQC